MKVVTGIANQTTGKEKQQKSATRAHNIPILNDPLFFFNWRDYVEIFAEIIYIYSMMKPLLVTTLLINLSILPITTDNPDFLVSDIVVRPNKFIYIKLENRSLFETQIEPEKLDKIFLVIFINQIKRAEYKLKYINKKLFQKHSTVLLRTNFQFTTPIEVRIEMNQDKIISESNYANNTLSKSLK